MLKEISIRNYALIERVEINFASGFSVITGETGHGKSVFLGAIAMLLGQRSDVKSIREGADKCIVEGCFDITGFGLEPLFEENGIDYDNECIVRRELSASGRSRAFVNDTPVGVALQSFRTFHPDLSIYIHSIRICLLPTGTISWAFLTYWQATGIYSMPIVPNTIVIHRSVARLSR